MLGLCRDGAVSRCKGLTCFSATRGYEDTDKADYDSMVDYYRGLLLIPLGIVALSRAFPR